MNLKRIIIISLIIIFSIYLIVVFIVSEINKPKSDCITYTKTENTPSLEPINYTIDFGGKNITYSEYQSTQTITTFKVCKNDSIKLR